MGHENKVFFSIRAGGYQGMDPPEEMSIISWNCCGLGRPWSVRAIQDVCRSNKPQISGLIETKLLSKDWQVLRIKLGFQHCFVVDR